MKISFSNIAWERDEDVPVSEILLERGITAVDIAPGRYFPDIVNTPDRAVETVRAAWNERGIEITGMQSLLFGVDGFNVFADDGGRRRMLDYLGHVCRIGGGLGAGKLVFGSPRNRDRAGLDDEQVLDLAVPFFRALGDRAAEFGVVITLEPNPSLYGANFMTTSEETAAVVRAVDHEAIRMQLDVGACTLNAEDMEQVTSNCRDVIAHVHLSEPHLVPVGDGETDHVAAARAILETLPDRVACIEMRRPTDEPAVRAVRRAASFVVEHYSGTTS